MRTVVISDLHLGARSGKDVLRLQEPREALYSALAPGDRLVILGDGIELREVAHRDAAAVVAPFFGALGQRLGADGELVIVAGNHDHSLLAATIDQRLRSEPEGFLDLAERIEPVGALARDLVELARPVPVRFSYPGIWLRDDVYALHGHYLDVHSTVPALERLAAGIMERWVIDVPCEGARPDDYEAALAPIYSFMDLITQRGDHAAVSAGAGASARIWRALAGTERGRVQAALLGLGYAGAVTALNALGIGPVDRDLSASSLRRGGLYGISEVLRRLGVRAKFALFGHTHRSGPWPTDDPSEWITATGTRSINTGCWVSQPHFQASEPPAYPYRPGAAVVIEGDQPPRLVRLLDD